MGAEETTRNQVLRLLADKGTAARELFRRALGDARQAGRDDVIKDMPPPWAWAIWECIHLVSSESELHQNDLTASLALNNAEERIRERFLQYGVDCRVADFGWRDRPPTAEEMDAHDGRWLECADRTDGVRGVLTWVCSEPPPGLSAAIHGSKSRWRPVTRDLMPAPWPKDDDDG